VAPVWDLKPEHCRAARYLLRWSVADLARASGVSQPALGRFERGETSITVDTLRKILAAFEAEGVDFGPAEQAAPHVHCGDGVRVTLRSK
jgi:transcriptional regulator with XRE-family HTH domain